jgi:hypothetical protein
MCYYTEINDGEYHFFGSRTLRGRLPDHLDQLVDWYGYHDRHLRCGYLDYFFGGNWRCHGGLGIGNWQRHG